jgi:hypothetical protein
MRIELNADGWPNYEPDLETLRYEAQAGSNVFYKNLSMPHSMFESFPPVEISDEAQRKPSRPPDLSSESNRFAVYALSNRRDAERIPNRSRIRRFRRQSRNRGRARDANGQSRCRPGHLAPRTTSQQADGSELAGGNWVVEAAARRAAGGDRTVAVVELMRPLALLGPRPATP